MRRQDSASVGYKTRTTLNQRSTERRVLSLSVSTVPQRSDHIPADWRCCLPAGLHPGSRAPRPCACVCAAVQRGRLAAIASSAVQRQGRARRHARISQAPLQAGLASLHGGRRRAELARRGLEVVLRVAHRLPPLYTSYTRGVKAFQSYTAKTALYSIQLYSAIHYTTSTSPLCACRRWASTARPSRASWSSARLSRIVSSIATRLAKARRAADSCAP